MQANSHKHAHTFLVNLRCIRTLPTPIDGSRFLKDASAIGLKACQHVRQPSCRSRALPHAASRCLQVRAKLPLDGNAAAFFKCVGELAVHANDLPHARELFVECVPLFREVCCFCAFLTFAAISQLLCIHSRCYVAVDHCHWHVMSAGMIECLSAGEVHGLLASRGAVHAGHQSHRQQVMHMCCWFLLQTVAAFNFFLFCRLTKVDASQVPEA